MAGRREVRASPFNAEASPESLVAPITPEGGHFVRSHFPTPRLNAETHALSIEGAVGEPRSLTLEELSRFSQRTFAVTFECAGNNRVEMAPLPPGEPWGRGAVSTARWTGALLRDVLTSAVLRDDVAEILAEGADYGTPTPQTGSIHFARSLPAEVALEGDALIATEMNGEPIPEEHGGPLRLIVPGWYGVASVKWLRRLEARISPYAGFYQRDRYVYVDPDGSARPVTRMRVKSFISTPSNEASVGRGLVRVRGWAWSGHGPIEKVEVALGGGENWQEAKLLEPEGPYAWVPFEAEVTIPEAGRVVLRSRATDASGDRQPDVPQWNSLGYGNNAVMTVNLHVL